MSHFVLFRWIMIQIFIAHTVSESPVRGIIGQPVTLPCSYRVTRSKDISDVCWGRGPCPNSKCRNKILHTTGREVTFRASQRYNLHGSVSFGDVSLTIGTAKAEDAGIYCCRVEIPGLFNDIKKNIRLEVARAPPVTTATTTNKAPVSTKHFTETTFAPQTTSGLQPMPETAVPLTTSTPPPATTATESPAVTPWDTSAPSATAVTEDDIFPVTVVETSAPPDFPTTSQAADVTTEDDMFCFTLPGRTEVTTESPGTLPTSVTTESSPGTLPASVTTESSPGTLPASVTTEFPGALPAAEDTTSSVMMEEEVSAMEVSANSDGSAEKREGGGRKFLGPAVLTACLIAGSILLIVMISLVCRRKHAKKFLMKSAGPPGEAEKVFSGAEGENNIFSL